MAELRSLLLQNCLSSEKRFVSSVQCGGKVRRLFTLEEVNRSEVEKISKALADATRLRIFEAISKKAGMNCGELVSLRGVTPATVSHHLKILNEAGLIACRRQGQFVYNEAVPEKIAAYTKALLKIGQSKKPKSKPHR